MAGGIPAWMGCRDLTKLTCKFFIALAREAIYAIRTVAIVLTLYSGTVIDVNLTEYSSVPVGAETLSVYAKSSILAKCGVTYVYFNCAVLSSKTCRTFTHVCTHKILTAPSILARVSHTFVNVNLTEISHEPYKTLAKNPADISINFDCTHTVVLTCVLLCCTLRY